MYNEGCYTSPSSTGVTLRLPPDGEGKWSREKRWVFRWCDIGWRLNSNHNSPKSFLLILHTTCWFWARGANLCETTTVVCYRRAKLSYSQEYFSPRTVTGWHSSCSHASSDAAITLTFLLKDWTSALCGGYPGETKTSVDLISEERGKKVQLDCKPDPSKNHWKNCFRKAKWPCYLTFGGSSGSVQTNSWIVFD